ncbi:gametogenetin-binding protein 2-like isoform X3 [Palaemon carinicauda]|uniref:gametogenetin-binding protein 2-like isoform X3 n=1 Tax=Palaemon carinicauda TaxID=392227 RepID=UPI0035B64C45
MAKLVGVYDEEDEIQLGRRQLPLSVYDNKIMTMQLGEGCDGCGITGGTTKRRCDESFSRQYNKLSKEDVEAALMVPSKTLFIRLAQTVGCVGCRRSVERLFNQLKDSGHPALEPLAVTNNGVLTVLRKYALQARSLGALFSDHGLALSVVLDNIPKLKKSGRCVLHSMEGIRCRPGGRSWRDVWEVMDSSCRETVTLISSDHLLSTLDNYLRKHRFCQECKNKVHRAFDILVGHTTIDPAKEKGYVASLYSGIRRCEAKRHIHVPADSDYVSHIITRAEPELQGRRERHAKTLEIAQEEVLTCLGLFLYERLQRIHTRMREEEQTWDILFHVALDALKKSFEVAVEEKQGYSKFELLCEELQRQELKEKAKKEKKKKKKKNKKNDEGKENNCLCDDEEGCRECEFNMSSQSSCSNQRSSLINTTNKQGSRDGGYCSAHGSGGSSRDSSEVACGEGLCSHYHDDHVDYSIQNEHHHNHMEDEAIDHLHPPLSPSPSRPYQPFTLSLQQMLEDSRCEDEEIPEAEVRAWRARLGIVKQKRAELRQTLRQRFQQFCHRGCGEASMTSINGSAHICHHHAHSPHGALPAHHISVMKPC